MHSPLLSLPNELLYEVASHIPSTASSEGQQQSDIAAFTTTCKVVRAATLPILFHTVRVSSGDRLSALAGAPLWLLAMVRNFAIAMDLGFFEALARAFDTVHFGFRLSDTSPALLESLAHILSNMPRLSSLAIRMDESSADLMSGWCAFPRVALQSVSFGPAMAKALAKHSPNLRFDELKNLHLDGMCDLGPVLPYFPNLTNMALTIPEGFNESDCAQFVKDLALVPKVVNLTFSPFSLNLEAYSESPAALVEQIAYAVPSLRTLDMRTRSFCHGKNRMIITPRTRVKDHSSALLNAILLFPCLTELAVPIDLSLHEEKPMIAYHPEAGSDELYSYKHHIAAVDMDVVSPFVTETSLTRFAWVRTAALESEGHVVAFNITRVGGKAQSIVRIEENIEDASPNAAGGSSSPTSSVLGLVNRAVSCALGVSQPLLFAIVLLGVLTCLPLSIPSPTLD